jgi:hypothetical protein
MLCVCTLQDLLAKELITGADTISHSDVGRTINADGYVNNTAMTDEACINYCQGKGYQYAGTEYYDECCQCPTFYLADSFVLILE